MAKLTNDQVADMLTNLVEESYASGDLKTKERQNLLDWIDKAWERGRGK